MSRPKRSAAAMAEVKIKSVLDWEELPENSAELKACAKRIDAEFAAEQKCKRVKSTNMFSCEDWNTVGQEESDEECEEETDAEIPTVEDLAFIDDDDEYDLTDDAYQTAASDFDDSSDVSSMLESQEGSEEGREEGSEEGSEEGREEGSEGGQACLTHL